MKKIKILSFCVVFFSLFLIKGQEVEMFNVGILPVSSNVSLSKEQTSVIQKYIKKAFVDVKRFTVFEGDSLFSKLKADSILFENNKKNVSKNTLNVHYAVLVHVQGLKSVNSSQQNSSGGYDKGVQASSSMSVKIVDLKTKKNIFDEALYHSDFYKSASIDDGNNNTIYRLCEFFNDIVNYNFPVELTIEKIVTANKKGIAETIAIKNAEYMHVHIKKGFLDYPNSKFEVYYLDESGAKQVVGKLEAKEIIDLKLICEVDKGSKEISKKLLEGKTLYLKMLDNSIEYFINQRK